jgi:hypothetical protein
VIQAKLNETEFNNIISAIDGIKNIVMGLCDSIPEESAREFANQIKSNITTQRFGDFGFPHKDWKKGLPNEDKFWLLLGTVYKSIKPMELSGTADMTKWFVGMEYSGGAGGSTPKTGKRTIINKKLKAKETKSRKPRTPKEPKEPKVKRIDPKGYILQKKSFSQTLGGGKEIDLGHAGPRKPIPI